ncbi:DUF4350 domain-containing protein [Microbacterium galbinum]|uniref:DUF4350 domain-containing protein n=1 Tax=Microbacterium galbinum TaxID=2851646 RepID=A0ABY4ITA4_9MICO|nr:DUF4350 domain-containing protein [Microbacterium galbinum]UPL15237.1 DUF4350 domain-containing protein [Microbacterium galbinum]
MTVTEERITPPTTAEPTRRLRSIIGWVIVAALVVGVAWVGLQIAATAPSERRSLDPEGRGDAGALALAEILRDQGVEVDVYRSHVEARDALDESTTLVMTNPYTLSDEGLADLIGPADRVVFLSVGAHLLDDLDLGAYSSAPLAEVDAQCTAGEFAEVGTIEPDRLMTPHSGVEWCFGDEEGAAVLIDDSDGRRTSIVDGSRLFSNAYLAENGNAALALALLGQTDRVVWYVPSLGDSDIEATSPDTLGTLTPPWVTPAIILLMLSGAAAALWRGRRFGPLVAETLPVTVRASETMHGRARLTAKAADAPHAALAIRDGAQRRLARRLGLTARATSDEVADAASDRLRIPRGTLQALLAGPLPTDDAALVELARRLAELEEAVEKTHRTARATDAPSAHTPSTTEAEDTRDR